MSLRNVLVMKFFFKWKSIVTLYIALYSTNNIIFFNIYKYLFTYYSHIFYKSYHPIIVYHSSVNLV